MEFLFDWIVIEDIKKYMDIYPITGITSNPSIIKKAGKIDFFSHFREIRKLIGMDKTLHIQVTAKDAKGMVEQARVIKEKVDDKVYIKIPVTEQGLKAMRILKAENTNITATAIYTKIQGLLAMEAGADFIAPYFNRMENLDIDAKEVIRFMSSQIEKYGYKTKILAASFKNMSQVNSSFEAGAQTATVQPSLLHDSLSMSVIERAVDDFSKDWTDVFEDKDIRDM